MRRRAAGRPVEADHTVLANNGGAPTLRQRMVALQMACAKADLGETFRLTLEGFGHELRGPLGVLVLRLELMLIEAEEHALPRIVRDDLAVLRRHLERLAAAIEVVLPPSDTDHD
jgi:signal transduction histidine kinase